MKNYFLMLTQIFVGATFWIWAFSGKIKIIVEREFKIEDDKKYLIVANHFSKLDPFLITSFLPGKTKFRLLPYRYLVTEEYMKRFWIRKIITLFGGFSVSAERNKGEKPLKIAQKCLDKHETVFIFPEGKINKTARFDNKIRLGIGASYLERSNKDLFLIPVKITKKEGRFLIKYKKPFRHKYFEKDLGPIIKDIMNRIYER